MNYQITVNISMKQLILFCTFTIFTLMPNSVLANSIDNHIKTASKNQTQCEAAELDFLECKVNSAKISAASASSCSYYHVGGVAFYFAYMAFAAFLIKRAPLAKRRIAFTLIPVCLFSIFILGLGGSRACYRENDVLRNINFAICTSNMEKVKSVCNKQELESK
jgi:hypothetical protein